MAICENFAAINIKTVFGILPVIILYIEGNSIILKGDAWSYGPIIIIKERYKFDKGLLIHELEHTKYWYKRLFKIPTIETFEQEELLCFAKQLNYYKKHDADHFEDCFEKLSNDICNLFGLTESVEDAKRALTKLM